VDTRLRNIEHEFNSFPCLENLLRLLRSRLRAGIPIELTELLDFWNTEELHRLLEATPSTNFSICGYLFDGDHIRYLRYGVDSVISHHINEVARNDLMAFEGGGLPAPGGEYLDPGHITAASGCFDMINCYSGRVAFRPTKDRCGEFYVITTDRIGLISHRVTVDCGDSWEGDARMVITTPRFPNISWLCDSRTLRTWNDVEITYDSTCSNTCESTHWPAGVPGFHPEHIQGIDENQDIYADRSFESALSFMRDRGVRFLDLEII